MILAAAGLARCVAAAEDTFARDDHPACTDDDLDRFMSEMSNLGITYDYDPSESPADLRDMADLVVEGALVDITEASDELVFTVDVAAVLKGDRSAESDQIRFALGFNPAERTFGDIADGFTPGLRGVFFLVSPPTGQPALWYPLGGDVVAHSAEQVAALLGRRRGHALEVAAEPDIGVDGPFADVKVQERAGPEVEVRIQLALFTQAVDGA